MTSVEFFCLSLLSCVL